MKSVGVATNYMYPYEPRPHIIGDKVKFLKSSQHPIYPNPPSLKYPPIRIHNTPHWLQYAVGKTTETTV
ncbi:unnamed protein product, partial [Brenthis ino]